MDTNVAIVVPTNKNKNKQENDLMEQLKLINGILIGYLTQLLNTIITHSTFAYIRI